MSLAFVLAGGGVFASLRWAAGGAILLATATGLLYQCIVRQVSQVAVECLYIRCDYSSDGFV